MCRPRFGTFDPSFPEPERRTVDAVDDVVAEDRQAIAGGWGALLRILVGLLVMGTITILLSFGSEGITSLFVS